MAQEVLHNTRLAQFLATPPEQILIAYLMMAQCFTPMS